MDTPANLTRAEQQDILEALECLLGGRPDVGVYVATAHGEAAYDMLRARLRETREVRASTEDLFG